MKLMFMACAQSSAVDSQTGQLSLFHLLEQMQVTAFPTSLSFVLVGMFAKEAADSDDQSVRLKVALDDTALPESSVAFSFAGKLRNRVLITINRLGIPGPGILSFSFLSASGEPLGSAWPIVVEKVVAPASGAPSVS